MAKGEYYIDTINADTCLSFLEATHYLHSGAKPQVRAIFRYGLFRASEILQLGMNGTRRVLAVCTFGTLSSGEVIVGAFGLPKTQQMGFVELTRLAVDESVRQAEHNITSWFASRCIGFVRNDYKKLRGTKLRAIISYADSSLHAGTIYKALGFSYYGLSDPKYDWKSQDGTIASRAKRARIKTEKIWRSRKHRFIKIFDKSLRCLLEEQQWCSSISHH